MDLKSQLDTQNLPQHVAIIMDGNGRWAKEKGQDRLFGHYSGVESVRDIVEECAKLNIEYLTVYAFSTENWDRPKDEVTGLMELLVQTVHQEVPSLNKNNVRLHVIGNIAMMPPNAQKELKEACAETETNTGLNLVMALSYSSRWEILNAVQQMAKEVEKGDIKAEEITEEVFQNHLCTATFPDPELIIRTSGEYRISNFLLYQIAYAELYFTDTLWPDFRKENLHDALLNYQNRERRFGKTSEQL